MTFLERDLLEQINQLREELVEAIWASAWYEAHIEDAERSANYWQTHYMKAREENAKLVKALEWISNGRMYGNEAADCARRALSELRGGTQ